MDSKLTKLLGLLPSLVRGNSCTAYVGANRTNMGDLAMYVAYSRLFPEQRLCDIPAGGRNRVLKLANRVNRVSPVGAVALGGGTLVGRPIYRRRLNAIFSILGDVPAFTLGVGVEDPEFGQGRTDFSELKAWKELLGRFQPLTVRGPRSKEILAQLGIESEVVGDPALIFADDNATAKNGSRLIGLNIGPTSDLWGSQGELFETVAQFAGVMAQRGWTIRLIPVCPQDRSDLLGLASQLPGCQMFEDFLNIGALRNALRECAVFVGQKLHSVVLASCVYVPSVMLEYRPKCRDFQESIGRADFNIRTDKVYVDDLVDLVDDLWSRRKYHQAELVKGVRPLRDKLLATAHRIQADLSSGGDLNAAVTSSGRL